MGASQQARGIDQSPSGVHEEEVTERASGRQASKEQPQLDMWLTDIRRAEAVGVLLLLLLQGDERMNDGTSSGQPIASHRGPKTQIGRLAFLISGQAEAPAAAARRWILSILRFSHASRRDPSATTFQRVQLYSQKGEEVGWVDEPDGGVSEIQQQARTGGSLDRQTLVFLVVVGLVPLAQAGKKPALHKRPFAAAGQHSILTASGRSQLTSDDAPVLVHGPVRGDKDTVGGAELCCAARKRASEGCESKGSRHHHLRFLKAAAQTAARFAGCGVGV
ncbi:hypothetical protein BC567DRAFT_252346 [Phyllosticta citribraziliensis]